MIKGKFLDVKETAEYCHISRAQVYRLIHSDPTFPAVRIGNKYLFEEADLQNWIQHKKTVTLRGVKNDK